MTAPDTIPGRRGLLIFGLLLLLAGAFGVWRLSRSRANAVATERSSRASVASAGPIVRTTRAARATGTRDVVLQGEAQPWASVTLYAKVSGYLKTISVDKGDRVTKGEDLAEIESPETDNALLAAEADAQDKRELARRDQDLLAKHFVSPEESEDADAAAKIAEARLEGLNQEKEYEVLRAPFDGTVTARYADPGALVQNAATSQTSALPVLTIADVFTLRVRIFLDQTTAQLARRGQPAEIRLPEQPGFALHAAISRITQELDPKTRTLLAELDVDNRDGKLLAGSFVEVHLALPAPAAVSVPAEAVVMRSDHPFVGVVDSADRVRLRPVTLGETDGTQVDILRGIAAGDRIALNLGESVTDGTLVRVDSMVSGPQ